MDELPKLIVILGPTASGKTVLANTLANKFNGEIISADSRQVYKHMKIGTDVPEGKWKDGKYMVQGAPNYLMDCIEPDQEFSLADFKKRAVEIIKDIHARGKLPFLVGGTGLYISSLVDNFDIPKIEPDQKLRKELESKTLGELVKIIKEKDPASAEIIDLNNPRRVVRALEVVLSTGVSFIEQRTKSKPRFDVLQIGVKRPRQELYERVNQRVDEQIKQGLVEEVMGLLARDYSWDLPSMSGLGYRQFREYLSGKQGLGDAVEVLKRDIRRYAKRQISWFKRDQRIKWIEPGDLDVCFQMITEHTL
ncbi:MAG: tRNA (adenosine(37)-N6)-dimethylallyltransferase MiaA [bacterium]